MLIARIARRPRSTLYDEVALVNTSRWVQFPPSSSHRFLWSRNPVVLRTRLRRQTVGTLSATCQGKANAGFRDELVRALQSVVTAWSASRGFLRTKQVLSVHNLASAVFFSLSPRWNTSGNVRSSSFVMVEEKRQWHAQIKPKT